MINAFSKNNKYILGFAICFMLLPIFQQLVPDMAFVAAGVVALFILVAVVWKKDEHIFAWPFGVLDWFMLLILLVGILDIFWSMFFMTGAMPTGLFLTVIALMYYVERSTWEITKECLIWIFYAGTLVILLACLFFTWNTDIFFGIGIKDKDAIAQVGLFSGLIGAYIFSQERDFWMQIFDGVGTGLCIVCLSLSGHDVAVLLLMLGMIILTVNAQRDIVTIKRLLLCLFLAAFVPCNVILLSEYTELIQVKVSVLSLQASVVVELLLCLLAVMISSKWDKVEDAEDVESAIRDVQELLRRIFHYGVRLFAILLVVGWIDWRVGMENLVRLFHNSEWKPEGIFVTAFIEITVRMGRCVAAIFKSSGLCQIYNSFGAIGLVLGLLLWGLLTYEVWHIRYQTMKEDVIFWILSMVIAFVYLLMPFKIVLAPIFMFVFMMSVHKSEDVLLVRLQRLWRRKVASVVVEGVDVEVESADANDAMLEEDLVEEAEEAVSEEDSCEVEIAEVTCAVDATDEDCDVEVAEEVVEVDNMEEVEGD